MEALLIFAVLVALAIHVSRSHGYQERRTNYRIDRRRSFRAYDYDRWWD